MKSDFGYIDCNCLKIAIAFKLIRPFVRTADLYKWTTAYTYTCDVYNTFYIGKTEQVINKRRLKENGFYQDIIFSSVLPFDYGLKGSEIAVATTTNNNTVNTTRLASRFLWFLPPSSRNRQVPCRTLYM